MLVVGGGGGSSSSCSKQCAHRCGGEKGLCRGVGGSELPCPPSPERHQQGLAKLGACVRLLRIPTYTYIRTACVCFVYLHTHTYMPPTCNVARPPAPRLCAYTLAHVHACTAYVHVCIYMVAPACLGAGAGPVTCSAQTAWPAALSAPRLGHGVRTRWCRCCLAH